MNLEMQINTSTTLSVSLHSPINSVSSMSLEKHPEYDSGALGSDVKYNDEVLAVEKGFSKKEAEQKCAYSACKKLGIV